MIKEPKIQLLDLIMSLSEAVDLISPAVANHHFKVAYIAFSLGTELQLPVEQLTELVLAGILHDIGALSLKERLEALQFEFQNPHQHAERGYLLLKNYTPFRKVAELILYHHVSWNFGAGAEYKGKEVPKGSHIIHLADRVAILIGGQREVLGQAKEILKRVESQSGKMFMPELVEAFKSLAFKESFWLEAASPSIGSILSNRIMLPTLELDMEKLTDIAKLFSQIIDFRSRFTATHSSGVAASAELLAKLAGFSGRECQMMRIAGYLHDLGKLAVPPEILEKPRQLTKEEFEIIRCHPFFTYRILEPLKELYEITTWASFHHERLDGNGYPFHYSGHDLPLGARIMAVADVFCAITEDRPYRKGLTKEEALNVLDEMAESSALDANIVSLLKSNFDEVNSSRIKAQMISTEQYRNFYNASIQH